MHCQGVAFQFARGDVDVEAVAAEVLFRGRRGIAPRADRCGVRAAQNGPYVVELKVQFRGLAGRLGFGPMRAPLRGQDVDERDKVLLL